MNCIDQTKVLVLYVKKKQKPSQLIITKKINKIIYF